MTVTRETFNRGHFGDFADPSQLPNVEGSPNQVDNLFAGDCAIIAGVLYVCGKATKGAAVWGTDAANNTPGAGTVRTVEGALGEEPYDELFLWQVEDSDLNGTVIIPLSEDPSALQLPTTTAEVGDTLVIRYGDPTDIGGGGDPLDVNIGMIATLIEGETHIGIAILPGAFAEATLAITETMTLQKLGVAEVPSGSPPSIAYYHVWVALSVERASESSSSGGSSVVVRYDSNGYNVPEEEFRYNSFQGALNALRDVGGGTMEIVGGGIPEGDDGEYDGSNVHFVGVGSGWGVVGPVVQIGDAVIRNALSIKNLRVQRSSAPASPPVFVFDGSRKFIVDNCDIGEAYAATSPLIGEGVRNLVLKGATVLGEGSVLIEGAVQLDVDAHDTSRVAEDAIEVETVVMRMYNDARVNPSQVGVSDLAIYRGSIQRLVPTDQAGTGAPAAWAGRFLRVDTTGGPATVPVPDAVPFPGGVEGEGSYGYVTKVGDGGDLTLTGLTYVPGGGTTYVIVDENATVMLVWLEGGVQVLPFAGAPAP